MMLRSKVGDGVFVVEDLKTGQKDKIKPEDYLDDKQARKMYTHPDMILQFAHYLRDQYQINGETVAIYADIQVQLNGRTRTHYIDPSIDLTKIEWTYWESKKWIAGFNQKAQLPVQ